MLTLFLTVFLWLKRETIEWESWSKANGFPPSDSNSHNSSNSHNCDDCAIFIIVTSRNFLPGSGVTSSRVNNEEQFTLGACSGREVKEKLLVMKWEKNHLCSHMSHELPLVNLDRLIKVAERATTLLKGNQVRHCLCLCHWASHFLW